MDQRLNIKEEVFVSKLAASGDMLAAYRTAYACKGLGDSSVMQRAESVLRRPRVAMAYEAQKRTLGKGEPLVFDIKGVMQEWYDIATADPNEIVSLAIDCCRHCWGFDFQYQWTEQEYNEKVNEHLSLGLKGDPPQAHGGFGFDFTQEPNDECPYCRGRGVVTIVNHDTRKLSRKARKLYAGIGQSKFGPVVLMRDQDAALANIAKALGMFVEKVKLDATMQAALTKELPTDPLEAARAYMDLVTDSE